jgi:predicted NBD/HSP70 family sugar kinase
LGVDIGGTFSDVALIDEETGRIGVAKVPTTPHDFTEGVMEGLRRGLAPHGVDPAKVSLLSTAKAQSGSPPGLHRHGGARLGAATARLANAT